MNEKLIGIVSQDIKKSKKYKSVYDKTIERVVGDFALKTKSQKEIEKKSRNLLHQIWGAFYASRPDFQKVLKAIKTELDAGKPAREAVLPALRLQSSVKERIPILPEFYKKIFEITGLPNSVIDYACGLNPLTVFWMGLPETSHYKAFDIDEDEIGFLNDTYRLSGVKNGQAALGDALIDTPEYADVVFLLKLLPCLEHQKKNSGLELLKNIPCKYIVVSFPVTSIGGKNVGMAGFYSNNFKNMIEKEGWQTSELLFDTELVFVIKK